MTEYEIVRKYVALENIFDDEFDCMEFTWKNKDCSIILRFIGDGKVTFSTNYYNKNTLDIIYSRKPIGCLYLKGLT